MIGRLYIAILRWRAKGHADRAHILGLAVVNAQRRRDWTGAAYFFEQFQAARAKRDRLMLRASCLARRIQRENDWLHASGETCPPCNHDCNEGRRCPARCR